MTELGTRAVRAAEVMIAGIETDLDGILGSADHARLRALLERILAGN